MSEQRYVSRKNETVRMFKSDFMEFFSHVHPATPLLLYTPVIACMLYLAFGQSRLSILTVAGLFLIGALIWTLLEYIIHRYAFHYEPRTRLGKQLHFIVHGVHHDYPNDAKRLVMPPAVSIPLAVAFYALFFGTLGRFAPGGFSGIWVRLRLLRHDPLRDTPFPDETRHLAVVETISSAPSLQ